MQEVCCPLAQVSEKETEFFLSVTQTHFCLFGAKLIFTKEENLILPVIKIYLKVNEWLEEQCYSLMKPFKWIYIHE